MILWTIASFLTLSPLNQTAPCRGCSQVIEEKTDQNLLVFISFSVPIETWLDFSKQMEKTGGVFVLNGIPDNSFENLAIKIIKLRDAGIFASIDIDPDLFETYEVEEAPTIVLREKRNYDKVIGNLRLDSTLRFMAETGDVRDLALNLLEKLS